MKRIIALLLSLLLWNTALAEDAFNIGVLREDDNLYAFTHPGTLDTVYRLLDQPYFGQVDEGFEGGLVVYVDFITLVDQDATLLRLMIAAEAFDPITAQELRMTVGGKRYTFAVSYEQSEYDGIFMEDYTTCLTNASLPLLKAIAQQKQDDPIPVELLAYGEAVFSGTVIIPGEDAAWLYDRFIDLGGKRQNLGRFELLWPCAVEKVK